MFHQAGLVSLFLFLACAFLVVAAPLPSDGLESFNDIYNRGLQLVPYEFDDSGDELLYARGTDFEDYSLFERDYSPLDPQGDIERRSFVSGIGNAFKSAGRAVSGAVNKVTSSAKNVVNKATSAVQNTVSKVTTAAKNVVNNTASAVKNTVNKVASTAKNVVYKATSAVKNTAKRVTSAAKNVVNKATSAVKKTVQRVTSTVKNGVKNTVKGVTSAVKNGVSAVHQGIRKAGTAIKQGLQWAKEYGPTIAKVGLKTLATGESVASKFAPFIPEVGPALAVGLKVTSDIENAVSDAIPVQLSGPLGKTMEVLNSIEKEQ